MPTGRAPSSGYLAQVGFIPIFEVLLSTVSCGGHFEAPDHMWERAGYVCYSGGHLALVVIAIILAAGFAAFVAVFAFVFVDSNPLSPGLDGRSSGRAAVLMLLWKVCNIARCSFISFLLSVRMLRSHPGRPHRSR